MEVGRDKEELGECQHQREDLGNQAVPDGVGKQEGKRCLCQGGALSPAAPWNGQSAFA